METRTIHAIRIKLHTVADRSVIIWPKFTEVGTWQLPGSASTTLELEAHELAMILRGVDLKSARRRARYQRPVAV